MTPGKSPETFRRAVDTALTVLALSFLSYQLYYIRAVPYEPTVHAVVHLGFAMLVLLTARLRETRSKLVAVLLACLLVAATAVTCYFYFNYKIILANPSHPPTIALVFGVIAVVVCFALARWAFGWLFPVLSMVGIAYVLYGRNLTGVWRAPTTSFPRAVTLLATDVTSPWGLYGNLLGISANYLFLFIIFGAILHAFGGLRFVFQLGTLAAARLRSGGAALAVISSALLGSITGSTAANVTITGSFTIPMMKEGGYTPEQASAIEAAASNGGQFLPPIMGATVFVMSAYTDIPYITIAKAAIVPALLYFLILFLYAELNARKLNIAPITTRVNTKELLLDAPLFIVPLSLLVTLLLKGYSLMFVVFWTTIVVISVGLLSATLRREARLEWNQVRETLYRGVTAGAEVAVLLAVIGIFVAALEVTGLTLKLSVILGRLAGDRMLLLLFSTMLASLILGTGVPTPAAYVIVATVLSPLLIRQGLPVLQAHLFPLFYAFMSHLTPPVGLGLLIACKIAASNYWRSAVEVFRAAFPSVLLPFFFIYTPGLLLQYESGAAAVVEVTAVSLVLFSFLVFLNNHWQTRLARPERLAMLAACLSSIVFIMVQRNYLWIGLSGLLCLLALGSNLRRAPVSGDAG